MAAINSSWYSSATCEWETPQELFEELDREFHFTLDPCSTDENAKCQKHYTKEQDGLSQDWTGETVYCNPPYGKEAPAWIRKCLEHSFGGGDCSNAASCPNGHESVPRFYLRKSGNPVHQRTPEIRQQRYKGQRTVPIYGRCVQRRQTQKERTEAAIGTAQYV